MDGEYQLQWDDKVDGKVESTGLKCTFRLEHVGTQVMGEFLQGLPGDGRKALLAGRMNTVPGKPSVLNFWQVEKGYTCSYEITVGVVPIQGVWHDTKGRRGDFTMQRYQ